MTDNSGTSGRENDDTSLTSGASGSAPSAADVLLALADRCEREEPSAWLASAILEACGHRTICYGAPPNNIDGWEWQKDGVGVWWRPMPRPDLSLDSAVTLVPESLAWSLDWEPTFDEPKRWTGEVYFPKFERVGRGLTGALALCAAALRARAALVQS